MIVNLAASVRARLMNHARETSRPFQEVFQYYAMERFLFRLSRSPYGRRFTLKDALMFRVWDAPMSRATRDVDLLGQIDNSLDGLQHTFREICRTEVEADGMVYDIDTITAEQIKEDADYAGARIRFLGLLEKARASMQVDIGFGDAVIPEPIEVDYPTILKMNAPRLLVYSRESVVAEKFQAMVFLGMLNSRMKDFYDIWSLTRGMVFEGALLARAIRATFEHRTAKLPTETPISLTDEFVSNTMKQAQWSAFLDKIDIDKNTLELSEVVSVISAFIMPVIQALNSGTSFVSIWPPGGPWRESEIAE